MNAPRSARARAAQASPALRTAPAVLSQPWIRPSLNNSVILQGSNSVADFGRSVAHRTTRIFQTVGGWFQEKFTGRNTIDPKHGQNEDDDEQNGSDPYSRPVNPEPPER